MAVEWECTCAVSLSCYYIATYQPQQHLLRCARILRVVLEAGTLEVLHLVLLIVCACRLEELFSKGVAELRETSMLVPVVEEDAPQGMTCRGEPLYTRLFRVGHGVCEQGWALLWIEG